MVTVNSVLALLQRAVEPATLAFDKGRLTLPRSWAVYELPAASGVGRRFRFGNHPVRHDELMREFGAATVLAVFTSRVDAEELQRLMNAGWSATKSGSNLPR